MILSVCRSVYIDSTNAYHGTYLTALVWLVITRTQLKFVSYKQPEQDAVYQ